jgi:cytochrome c5
MKQNGRLNMIKGIGMTALSLVVLLLGASMVIAAGDVDKGKSLFNDPSLGDGTAGRSCNTCHPGGKGLEGVGLKKEWKTPGGMHKTIEEAVNTCIVMALKGKPLDVRSEQMQALVSYLKSLKPVGKAKRKMIEGC